MPHVVVVGHLCQTLEFEVEQGLWSCVVEDPSRVVVDPSCDLVNHFEGEVSDVTTFGNETSQHAIGILVGSTLPSRVGVGVEELRPLSAGEGRSL